MALRPWPARLIVSLLAGKEEARLAALRALTGRLGPLVSYSEVLPFDWTRFYEKEMGPGLGRRLAAFDKLVSTGELAQVKAFCQQVEQSMLVDGGRTVNLDPGLVSKDSLILATHKYQGHRLELAKGIYAEVTLHFAHGKFNQLPWTYPDYASQEMGNMLALIRQRYLWQLSNQPDFGGDA